jgi:hypothetical protein
MTDMTTVTMVVEGIEAGPKNVEGGRTIMIQGQTLEHGIGHCVLTFATAAELDRLRAVLDTA